MQQVAVNDEVAVYLQNVSPKTKPEWTIDDKTLFLLVVDDDGMAASIYGVGAEVGAVATLRVVADDICADGETQVILTEQIQLVDCLETTPCLIFEDP